ncbi:MAG: hypothetical protein Q8K36_01640 [Alphaproteobacteria bacterium]|nr:hypothetical protein [Alphaproteobacteria bacterium]
MCSVLYAPIIWAASADEYLYKAEAIADEMFDKARKMKYCRIIGDIEKLQHALRALQNSMEAEKQEQDHVVATRPEVNEQATARFYQSFMALVDAKTGEEALALEVSKHWFAMTLLEDRSKI